jgi:pyruvate kinase
LGSIRHEDFDSLGKELNSLYVNTSASAEEMITRADQKLKTPEQICSRDNLFCYLALRKHDMADLQISLDEEGLSSLGMIENNVLFSMEQVLKHFGITPVRSKMLCKVSPQYGCSILSTRTRMTLGAHAMRRTRIMVTLDASDIFQYDLIEQLIESGMDIVRINCAHNTKREWKLLIESIRISEQRLIQRGRNTKQKCIILMDLGGPKIRIGEMEHRAGPLKIVVLKDSHGRSVRLVEGILDSEANVTRIVSTEGEPTSFVIAVTKVDYGGLGSLQIGQKIMFRDARDERLRALTVLERLSPTKVRVGLEHTAYLKEGVRLECQTDSMANIESKCSFTVGRIIPQPVEINVEAGNILRLYRDSSRLGHSANKSEGTPAGISCTHPEVLERVLVGHRVFIDDGKIEAVVRSSNNQYLELMIVSPQGLVAEIKSHKGINFPDSTIRLPALTAQDIQDLQFISEYADLAGLSFVQDPEDLYNLKREISKLHSDLGVVAKIETVEATHNLARILLAGLELSKFAVLIARGDLAVEVGFENLVFVQEDIMCMCESAHIPVILATQILESLTESGLRNRAETSDAIMGQRAECVMLNNGVHIVEAVKTLGSLLTVEEQHQMKKHQLFRTFTVQSGI